MVGTAHSPLVTSTPSFRHIPLQLEMFKKTAMETKVFYPKTEGELDMVWLRHFHLDTWRQHSIPDTIPLQGIPPVSD